MPGKLGRPDRYNGKEIGDRNWQIGHACEGVKSDLFYPTDVAGVLQAKMVCATCPVKRECLEHALKYNETFGVWGGESERERVEIKRRRKRKAA